MITLEFDMDNLNKDKELYLEYYFDRPEPQPNSQKPTTPPKLPGFEDWHWTDPLKQAAGNIARWFSPSNMFTGELESLIGLNDEEYGKRLFGGNMSLSSNKYLMSLARDPDRDAKIQDLLREQKSRQNYFQNVASAIDDTGLHRDPKGFWQNAANMVINAATDIGEFMVEKSLLGLPGAIGLNTFLGNSDTQEYIYNTLRAKGVPHDEAMKRATDGLANIADLAVRGGTTIGSMYLLGKGINPSYGHIGGISPLGQVGANIAGASAVSGAGSMAEKAMTDYRADEDIDALDLLKAGGQSAMTTAGIGLIGAGMNWRDIRDKQAIYNQIKNSVMDADYTEVNYPQLTDGTDGRPTLNAKNPAPINPDTEIVTGTPAKPSGFNDVFIRHGLNPESGVDILPTAYRNNIISDTDLIDIANNISPKDPLGLIESVKKAAKDIPPIVPIVRGTEQLLQRPAVVKGTDQLSIRPNVVKGNRIDPLLTPPAVVRGNITDPLLQPTIPPQQTEPTTPQEQKEQTENTTPTPVDDWDARHKEIEKQRQEAKRQAEIERQRGLEELDEFADSLIADNPELNNLQNRIINADETELNRLKGEFFKNISPEEIRKATRQDLLDTLKYKVKRSVQTGTFEDLERILESVTTNTITAPQEPIETKTPVESAIIPMGQDTTNKSTGANTKGNVSTLHEPDEYGYMGTLNVDHMGDIFNVDVYDSKVSREENEKWVDNYGEDYIEVAEDNGKIVAIYVPKTDDFIIENEYSKVGWVRNIEGELRKQLGLEQPKDYSDEDEDIDNYSGKQENNTPITPLGNIATPIETTVSNAKDTPTTPLSNTETTAAAPKKTKKEIEKEARHARFKAMEDAIEQTSDGGAIPRVPVHILRERAEQEGNTTVTPLGENQQQTSEETKQEEMLEEPVMPVVPNHKTATPQEWNEYYKKLYAYKLKEREKAELEARRKGKRFIPNAQDEQLLGDLKKIVDELERRATQSNTPITSTSEETQPVTPLGEQPLSDVGKSIKKVAEKSKDTQNVENSNNTHVMTQDKSEEPSTAPIDKVSASQKIADAICEILLSTSDNNKTLSNRDLFNIANKFFGGTQAEGKYTPRDAYDAMEMGVNQAIAKLGIVANSLNITNKFPKLISMLNRLPTQTNRTEEQNEFQQFSTPPTLAYVVNWLANVEKGDTVLEPSAGLGGLVIFAKNAGANLILNEYSNRRANLLESMKLGDVYREDGMQLANILLPRFEKESKKRPNKVIMNPPFSSTSGRIVNERDSNNGIKHVKQALLFMADGGRLVTILGKGTTSRQAWKEIESEYNVRAVINIDGRNYKKYGTSYGNQVVVIDKTAPQGDTYTANFKDLDHIINNEELKKIRDDIHDKSNSSKNEMPLPSDIPSKKQTHATNENTSVQLEQRIGEFKEAFDKLNNNGQIYVKIPDLREALGWERETFDSVIKYLRDNGIATPHTGDASIDTRTKDYFYDENNIRFGTLTWDNPNFKVGKTEAKTKNQTPPKPVVNADVKAESPQKEKAKKVKKEEITPKTKTKGTEGQKSKVEKQPNVRKLTVDEMKAEAKTYDLEVKSDKELKAEIQEAINEGQESEDINVRYQPIIKGLKHHPADVDVTKSLASIRKPPLKYRPKIQAEVFESGAISDIQAERVAYIGQALSTPLPSGENGGYLLGDKTGMGKARMISASIADAFAHGYGDGKAIWVSVNMGDLFNDASDNWAAVGGDPSDIFAHSDKKVASSARSDIKRDKGILFTAYSTLRYKDTKTQEDLRLNQILRWIGEDKLDTWDGIIVFDESHTAKNLIPVKKKRGKTKPSQIAQVIDKMQAKLPKARILYSSATAATELSHFGIYRRLGLWGEGTPFNNASDFIFSLTKAGLTGLEVISRQLKKNGRFDSASISFKGGPNGGHDNVVYRNLQHNLTPEQVKIYDDVAKAWFGTLEEMHRAATKTNHPAGQIYNTNGKSIMGTIGSQQQAVFNLLITSFKTDAIIEDIERQLKEGNSAVVQLTNTWQQKQNAGKNVDDDGVEIDDNNFNMSAIDNLFKIIEDNFPIYEFVKYRDEKGVERCEIATDSQGNFIINYEAKKMKDNLLKRFEYLKQYKIQNPIDAIINYFGAENVAEVTGRTRRIIKGKTESRSSNAREKDKDDFLNGEKRILIFSEAGGTGSSYHAGRNFINQQKRIHYLLQAGWKADTAMQGLGRTHRTNQAHKPEYVLVTTDIPGEKRFISTIARRLAQLGAITAGDRQDATQGIFSERDNLENDYALDAAIELISKLQKTLNYDILQQLRILNSERKIPDDFSVSTFFNRLLGLEIKTQKKIFSEFEALLDNIIATAKENGTYDVGLQTFKADSIKLQEEIDIPQQEGSNIELKYSRFAVKRKISYLTWDKLSSMKIGYKDEDGVIQKKTLTIDDFRFFKDETGELYATRDTGRTKYCGATDKSEPVFMRYKINGRKDEITLPYLENKGSRQSHQYEEIDKEEAQKLWEETISKQPEYALSNLHLVTGDILSTFSSLSEQAAYIIRLVDDNKNEYVGRVLGEDGIKGTLINLGLKDFTLPMLSVGQAKEILNDRNSALRIDRVTQLVKVRVNGEERLEISPFPYYRDIEYKTKYNAFQEIIRGENRLFIPNNEGTLQKIIQDFNLTEESKVTKYTWQEIRDNEVTEINDAIERENDLNNLFFIPPSMRHLFGGFGGGKAEANQLQLPPFDNYSAPYKSRNPKIRERMDESKTKKPTQKTLIEEVKKFAGQLWLNSKNRLPRLVNNEKFVDAVNIIDELGLMRKATTTEVVENFRIILKDLTPDDYELFENTMVIYDIAETYGMNEDALLSFGYTSETLRTDYEYFQSEVDKNPRVKKAIERAEKFGEDLRKQIFNAADKLGLYSLRDKLRRQHYFRHLVVEYYVATGGERAPRPTFKDPTRRTYMIRRLREGTEKDIVANWIRAMGEVYVRMIDDIKIMTALGKLRGKYDIIESLKAWAFSINMDNALKEIKKELLKDTLIEDPNIDAKAKKILDEELNSARSKAISKIFELAQNGELPAGFNNEWGELIHKLNDAGQLENLDEKTRKDFARYIGWILTNDMESMLTSNLTINNAARKMARRILRSEELKRAKLRKILKGKYVKVTDLIPLNHTLWSPSNSKLIFSANSIPDNVADIIMANLDDMLGIPMNEIAQILFSGDNEQMWVIPNELAETLNELGSKKPLGSFGRIVKKITDNFRKWVLHTPVGGRIIHYNQRNLFSDLEAVLQGNPHALKYIKRAVKEIHGYMVEKKIPTGDLKEFVKRGGVLTTRYASEITDWQTMNEFQHLIEEKKEDINILKLPVKFFRIYFDIAGFISNFREAILRYATFLSFSELIEKNGGTPPYYAMSKKAEVDALIGDIPAMAFKLANETIGAYNEISVTGQWLLDNNFLLFWAFQEANIRRYFQGYKNTMQGLGYDEYLFKKYGTKLINKLTGNDELTPQTGDGNGGGNEPPNDNNGNNSEWADDDDGKNFKKEIIRLAKKSPILAFRLLLSWKFAMGMAVYFSIFNYFFNRDNLEKLPPDRQNSLILGENYNGEILTLDGSAVTEAYPVDFSMIAFRGARDILNGKQTVKGLISDMISSPTNKILSNANPLLKLAIESVTGVKTYPDYRDRTPIRDYGEYVANQFNLGWYYKWLMGKPHEPFGHLASSIARVTKSDGSASYGYIVSKKKEFSEKFLGKSWNGFSMSEKSDALRNMRLSAVYGDEEKKLKYREEYAEADGDLKKGIDSYIRSLDPLNGLNKIERAQFLDWLTDEEYNHYQKAMNYYKLLKALIR